MNREILKAKIAEAISSTNTSGNQKLKMILAAVDIYSSADNGAKPIVKRSCPHCRSTDVVMFTADDDWCLTCDKTFPGA